MCVAAREGRVRTDHFYCGFICAHTQSFKQCTHTVLCLNSQLPSPLLAVLHTAGRSHLLAAQRPLHHNGRDFPALGFPGAGSYLINPGMLQQQHGQKPAIPILKVLYLTTLWAH